MYINITEEIELDYVSVQQIPSNISQSSIISQTLTEESYMI